MGMLDVWVAKPGEACQVDDHDWVVRIEDGHGDPFKWAVFLLRTASAARALGRDDPARNLRRQRASAGGKAGRAQSRRCRNCRGVLRQSDVRPALGARANET